MLRSALSIPYARAARARKAGRQSRRAQRFTVRATASWPLEIMFAVPVYARARVCQARRLYRYSCTDRPYRLTRRHGGQVARCAHDTSEVLQFSSCKGQGEV